MLARVTTAAIAILAVTACVRAAGPPPPPPEVSPIGTFDFTADFDGRDVDGYFTVTRNATSRAWGGIVVSRVYPDVPVTRVVVDGMSMTVTASTPDGPATLTLVFSDMDTFAGAWAFLENGGSIAGTRRMPE